MEFITKSDALALGLKRFFTGKPCNHGHISERFTSTSACMECNRITTNAWNLKNKERISKSAKARYLVSPKQVNKNPCIECGGIVSNRGASTRCLVCHRRYISANATGLKLPTCAQCNSKLSATKNSTGLCRACYLKNKVLSANPDAKRIRKINRRARIDFDGGKLSKELGKRLFKLQKGKCACCGQPLGGDYHMDHIMPLALGGSNTDDNIQLLRAKCNLQKNIKHPVDFMRMRGFLL